MLATAFLGRTTPIPADVWAQHQTYWRDRFDNPAADDRASGNAVFLVSDDAAEAELSHVRDHRLPPDVRAAVGFLLSDRDGHQSPVFLQSFEAGYSWGTRAEAFLLDSGDPMGDIIDRAADAYEARARLGHRLGFDSDEFGLAGAILAMFRQILPLAQSRIVTNGDATGFAAVDDGFDEWIRADDIVATDQDEGALRGLFHCGFAFYAFETRLLLAIRLGQRLERARKR